MPPPRRAAVTASGDAAQVVVLVSRLDDVVRRLDEIGRRMDERESRFEATFLPRREFELAQTTDSVQMRGIETEVHKISKRLDTAEDRRRADRALLLGSLAFPLLVLVLGALLLGGQV